MKKIPLFLSVAALAGGTYLVALACGGGYSGEAVRYSIFNKNVDDNTALAPFYFQSEFMDGVYDEAGQKRGINANALEWAVATGCTAADTAHIRRVVYERTAKDALRWATNAAKNTTDPREAKSVFMQAVSKNADLKGVPNYLAFAKKCEGATHTYKEDSNGWSEKPKAQKAYTALITEGTKMYADETNIFLKQRIGYQLVMLNRYNADWKGCKAAFEKYMANTTTKSVVYWWAMAHYATAHYWLGDAPKANYYLAQVFANDDYKKGRMHFGFDSDIAGQSMVFCKNNAEKIAVLSLSAIKQNNRTLAELQQIATIDANDPMLSSLLVREVNKVEDWVLSPRMIGLGTATNSLPSAEYDKKYAGVTDYDLLGKLNQKDDVEYAKTLYTWVAAQIAGGKVKNTALWSVCAAHLAFINQDFGKAETFLKQAEAVKTPLSKALQTQIHLTRIMASMNFDPKNGMTDDALLTELKWLQAERDANMGKVVAKSPDETYYYDISPAQEAYSEWMLAMAERAATQKNYVKQMLFLAQAQTPYSTPDGNFSRATDAWIYRLDAQNGANVAEELIAYASENPKNDLQKMLAAPIKKHVNRLWDVVGTKYYREDKLEQALAAYQKIPKTWFEEKQSGYVIYDTYLKSDPFWVGDFRLAEAKKYDRADFITQLIALKKAAKTAQKTDKKAALAAYQMGAAYYNTTFYGNAWARSRYWWSTGELQESFYESKTLNNSILERAKTAFEQAANLSADKGFKAVCTRMVAECQWHIALSKYQYTPDKEAPTLAEQPIAQSIKTTFGAAFYKDLVETCDGWQLHLQTAK
jgi:hypothetical protein